MFLKPFTRMIFCGLNGPQATKLEAGDIIYVDVKNSLLSVHKKQHPHAFVCWDDSLTLKDATSADNKLYLSIFSNKDDARIFVALLATTAGFCYKEEEPPRWFKNHLRFVLTEYEDE